MKCLYTAYFEKHRIEWGFVFEQMVINNSHIKFTMSNTILFK